MGAPGGRHQNMLSNGIEQRAHQGNAINTPIAERLQHRLQVEISRFTVNMEVGRGIKKRAGGYVQRVAQAQQDFERRQLIAPLDLANIGSVDAAGDLLRETFLRQPLFAAQALEGEANLASQFLLISGQVPPLLYPTGSCLASTPRGLRLTNKCQAESAISTMPCMVLR